MGASSDQTDLLEAVENSGTQISRSEEAVAWSTTSRGIRICDELLLEDGEDTSHTHSAYKRSAAKERLGMVRGVQRSIGVE